VADTFVSTVDGTVATFDVLYDVSGGARSVKAAGNVSVRSLPYGGGVVVQSAGRLPVYRTYRVLIANQSELTNLLHTRGDHGILTTVETGGLDCTLLDVDSGWIDFALARQEAVVNFVMDVLP
jgi:hypothetical protein